MSHVFSSLRRQILVSLALVAVALVALALMQWRLSEASSREMQRVSAMQQRVELVQRQALKAGLHVASLPVPAPFLVPGNLSPLEIEAAALSEIPEFSLFHDKLRQSVGALSAPGRYAVSYAETMAAWRSLGSAIQSFSAEKRAEIARIESQITPERRRAVTLFSFATAGLLAVIVVFVHLLTRSTVERLRSLSDQEEDFVCYLQEGKADLRTCSAEFSGDEVGRLEASFHGMRESLETLIVGLRKNGSSLDAIVQDNIRHFSDLATVTQNMGASATAIAQTALALSESAAHTADASKNGRAQLQQAARDLNSSADRVRLGVSRMESLANKVREVDQVVQIIRSIASQTNLLALNAAIEASRAGEAGKGFAVVAEEVRKLALQTSKSAENVIGLVQGIQDETQEAVKLIQLIEAESSTAAAGASSSQEIFESISENSSHLASQIQGVAAGTEEQRSTVETMAQRISELFHSVDQSLRPNLAELLKKIDGFRAES